MNPFDLADKALTWLLSPLERWEVLHDTLYCTSPIWLLLAFGGAVNLWMTIHP